MTRSPLHYWLPVLLWILLLSWLSTTSFSAYNSERLIGRAARAVPGVAETVRRETGWDRIWLNALLRKAAHVAVYLVLGFLLYRALGTSLMPVPAALLTLLLGAAAGAVDEMHQLFEPRRGAQVLDVGFDTTGVALGLLLALFVYRKRGRG